MGYKQHYVLTGGTMIHIAPHFSLCAPAYGKVGEQIAIALSGELHTRWSKDENVRYAEAQIEGILDEDPLQAITTFEQVHLIRTKMALGSQDKSRAEAELFKKAGIPYLETNEDLEKVIETLIADPDTATLVMAVAVCDWEPDDLHTMEGGDCDALVTREFGKKQPRLRTADGDLMLGLTPTDKLIGKIRKERKDIFLVGFKASTGLTEDEQYIAGLGLLKGASCNLVLSNDVHTRTNMVITPEEARYSVTKDRKEVVSTLAQMTVMRSGLTFTRSTVIPGDPIAWDSDAVPENLRTVVNYCIEAGAYKPFKDKTVGHFATRGPDGVIYTSRRKSNFNRLPDEGLLRIDTVDGDRVIAHGAKPSVGGQSQRIIFDAHSDVDCIVHFHVPLRGGIPGTKTADISVREQKPYECGSHECGRNTSDGLREHDDGIKAVMLDQHGPNICFGRNADPQKVIEFIEGHWDLQAKTGGPVSLPQ
jgi:hypothetical protein